MAERRFAAVMSIDVVGYSRMMQRDAATLLAALNEIFRSIVHPKTLDMAGRVVKLIGDGALIEFPSAFNALTCAVRIQEAMRSDGAYSYDEPIKLRIGLHAGDVLVEGKDLFGDCVNIAARLQAGAEAGGVLISRTIRDLAGKDFPYRLRSEGPHSFKNISEPIETLSIDFTEEAVRTRRAELSQSQEIRFCSSKDGTRLAWTATGNGPPLVKAPSWVGHLELDWRGPQYRHILASLSEKFQVVRFDARANGLSDWQVPHISFADFVDDLACVFDAAQIERAPILAVSQGCAVAAAYAARAPERVSGIVMIGGFATGRSKRTSEKDRAGANATQAMLAATWDDPYPSLRHQFADMIAPGASLEDRRQYAEDMHDMISAENVGRYKTAVDNLDITDDLPKVRAPCLVMHGSGDRMQPIEQGRRLAAGLPTARFLSYESNNHIFQENDSCWPLVDQEIHAFLQEVS